MFKKLSRAKLRKFLLDKKNSREDKCKAYAELLRRCKKH